MTQFPVLTIFCLAFPFLLQTCRKQTPETAEEFKFDCKNAVTVINALKSRNQIFENLSDRDIAEISDAIFPPEKVIIFDSQNSLYFDGIIDVVALFFQAKCGLAESDPYNNLLGIWAVSRQHEDRYPKDSTGMPYDDHNQVHLTPYSIYKKLQSSKRGNRFTGRIIRYKKTKVINVTVLHLEKSP